MSKVFSPPRTGQALKGCVPGACPVLILKGMNLAFHSRISDRIRHSFILVPMWSPSSGGIWNAAKQMHLICYLRLGRFERMRPNYINPTIVRLFGWPYWFG